VWAAVAGASALLGLLVSGALLAAFSWQAVFGVNVVLAVLAIAGTLRFVPESADAEAPKLDFVGAIIAVVGLVAIVYAVIEAPTAGWLSAQTLLGVGGGLVVLAGFIAWELRQPHPMLDPRVFRRPQLAAGSLSIFIQFFAFFGFVFIVLQYLQIVRGESPILASVSVLPLSGALIVTSRRAPALLTKAGARWVCVAGLALFAGGMLVLAKMGEHSSYLLQIAGIVPLGIGMGLAMTPATTGITESLPASQQGVGSALNDLSRELGGALGIAVLGSALTATYRSHLHLPGAPASIVTQARSSLAVAAKIGGSTATQAHTAFISGLHFALICASATAAIAAVLVAVLLAPRHARAAHTEASPETT
jgi:predicted MFS family arabinose efflux permease